MSPTEAAFSVLGPEVDEFVPAHLFPAKALSNNGVIVLSGFHSGADIFQYSELFKCVEVGAMEIFEGSVAQNKNRKRNIGHKITLKTTVY